MKKTPAQLKAFKKYYNKKKESGYVQLNVLIKKELLTALKKSAFDNKTSMQKALEKILNQSELNQENDSWSIKNIFK